jgi:hypothetical protein
LARISITSKRFSAPPIPLDNDTQRPSLALSSHIKTNQRHHICHSQEPHSAFSDDSHDYHYKKIAMPLKHQTVARQSSNDEAAKQNDVRILMTGPTKVILTAPTPSTNHIGPSRLLSGPRPLKRKTSSGSIERRKSVSKDISSSSSTILGDPFLIVSPKQKPHRRRRSSTSSTGSFSRREYERDENYISHPKKTLPNMNKVKGDRLSLSVKNDLPSTPLRSNTNANTRSLFRNVLHPGKVHRTAVPDPNLSSELSPVGRQMMDDVRQQRIRAREADRARRGSRF